MSVVSWKVGLNYRFAGQATADPDPEEPQCFYEIRGDSDPVADSKAAYSTIITAWSGME